MDQYFFKCVWYVNPLYLNPLEMLKCIFLSFTLAFQEIALLHTFFLNSTWTSFLILSILAMWEDRAWVLTCQQTLSWFLNPPQPLSFLNIHCSESLLSPQQSLHLPKVWNYVFLYYMNHVCYSHIPSWRVHFLRAESKSWPFWIVHIGFLHGVKDVI